MGLLEARQQAATRRRYAAQLADDLPAEALAPLFVSETRLEDVIDLAASLAVRYSPDISHDDHNGVPSTASLLLPGVVHCQAILSAEELLSQPEHLLVSVAEHWAEQAPETGELRKRCAAIRSLQQQQRRARMNMGRKPSS